MDNDKLFSFKPFEELNEFERKTLMVMLSGESATLASVVSQIQKNLFYFSLHHQKHLDERHQRQVYEVYGTLTLLVQRLHSVNFDLCKGDGVE